MATIHQVAAISERKGDGYVPLSGSLISPARETWWKQHGAIFRER